jgi:hypothetical protein
MTRQRSRRGFGVLFATVFVAYVFHAAAMHAQTGASVGPCAAMHFALRAGEAAPLPEHLALAMRASALR